jgi:Tol biopolymer transport system component
MTGDWPQSLPPDFRVDPWTSGEEGDVIAHLSANGRLLPDTYRAEDVFAVRHHAAQMTPEKRFEYLTNWILPADSDHGFHMTGEFAVVDQTEPRIVSPVFDWLETARQLGKLQECREKLLKMNVAIDAGEYQHRSHAALLMLVNLELSDSPAAAAAFEKLLPLLKAHAPAGIDEMWPETLLADAGARRFPTHAGVNELLTFLHTQRTQQWKPAGANLWHAHLAALYSRQQFVKGGGSEDVFSAPANLKDWIPVSAAKSSTRGPSYPTPLWHRTGDSIHKLVGHEDDFLYYRLPLAGDLSVECDLMRPSQHPSQVLLAGFYVGPRWDAKHLEVGTFRGAHPHEPVDPPFTPFGPWLRYRGVIHGDRLTVYLNGREVVSESLPMPRDPWIGIRCWSKHHCRVKDVRITGQPTVLQGVPLTDSTDLTGWVSYHEEAVSNSTGRWVHTGDPESSGWIVGKPNPALAGTFSESLLRYQRPLVEGGSVEYEFFYEPGVFETHPALDRLALMIQPDGIHEHRITDGRFERTDAGPAESVEIPRHRRGPAKLPLRPKDWNRVSLQLQGDMLALLLNDVVVYERPLESNNLRTFGLFHYADQGEVRVRRAVMRGAWGKNLPPLAEQELASPETRFLDEATPKLRSLFTHSFQKSGLPDKYFKVSTRSIGAQVSADQRGVQVNQSASGAWSTAEIAPRFHVYGDFDLVAAFTDLQPETDKDAGIMLVASVAGERNPNFRAYRRRAPNARQELQSSLTLLQQDGSRSYHGDTRPCESTSGRLRLSRRGDKVHYLFADGDSDNFQLTGSETCPQGPLENDGVKLLVTCNGEGSASVTWTRLEIQAERMTWLPAEAASMPLELQVISTDGRGLHTIATPDKAGYTHLGSPEWSADGKTIVLDMSAGSTTNSHIVLLNADGSDLKDVGTGCMPSLSADGRRIVFSEANTGVMMMNADGSGRELIDPNSWGVQWSPDGKWIAYCKSGNIVLMDAVTRKTRPLLVDKDAQRYDMIYWNLGWSHDSRLIGFKGRRRTPKGDDLAVVDIVKGEPIQILTPLGRDMIPDCTFSADNQRLIFAMPNPATLGPQLYSISLKQPAPPQLLTTLPADHKVFGVAMSRDGKRLVITSQQSTPPVEWIDEVTSGTVAK